MTQTNLPTKQTDSQTQASGLMVAKGLGGGGGENWELGISRCQLLHIGWINKVLLYGTGSHIQHAVINRNGKEYEKECVCVYRYMYV